MSECNSIKYVDLTYCQKNRDVILIRAKDYYENDKERYRNLSEKEKNKKREYGSKRYRNMPEEKKTKIKRISKKLLQGYKVSIL